MGFVSIVWPSSWFPISFWSLNSVLFCSLSPRPFRLFIRDERGSAIAAIIEVTYAHWISSTHFIVVKPRGFSYGPYVRSFATTRKVNNNNDNNNKWEFRCAVRCSNGIGINSRWCAVCRYSLLIIRRPCLRLRDAVRKCFYVRTAYSVTVE